MPRTAFRPRRPARTLVLALGLVFTGWHFAPVGLKSFIAPSTRAAAVFTVNSTADTDDGLSGDEGQFLACSFWLVNALARNGRLEEARALFERLIGLSNDLGLLAEEYDVKRQRQVGNFPQAFSHLTLIGAAAAIAAAEAEAVAP